MKKFMLGFATIPLLALLATSCAKESVESKGNDTQMLSFQTIAGKATLSRAAEVDNTAIQAGTVRVRSYNSTNGAAHTPAAGYYELTYNGSAWVYANPEYHPDYALIHYSTVPDQTLTPGANAATASFEYTTSGKDEDLIVASTTSSISGTNGEASLVFDHVLSEINFAVSGFANATATITNLKMGGVMSKGTYTINGAGWSAPTDAYVPTYTVTANKAEGAATVRMGAAAAGTMLIPQTHGTSSSGAFFEFDYTLKNATVSGSTYTETTTIKTGHQKVFFGDITTVSAWQPGKRYVYTINFETPNMLTFDVTVNSWENYDGSNGTVTIPTI